MSDTLRDQPLRETVIDWLLNVPGLPPILQSIHILSVAIVIGTIVMINLRFLGAIPSQDPLEMMRRLLPWTWIALPVLFLTGACFVLARPDRYIYNPIANWKAALIISAILTIVALQVPAQRQPEWWTQSGRTLAVARTISLISILLWLAIIFAGRWIAYVDYLIY